MYTVWQTWIILNPPNFFYEKSAHEYSTHRRFNVVCVGWCALIWIFSFEVTPSWAKLELHDAGRGATSDGFSWLAYKKQRAALRVQKREQVLSLCAKINVSIWHRLITCGFVAHADACVCVWMESEQAAVRLLFAHRADGGHKRNQAGGAKAAHPRRPSIFSAHALADSWRSTIFWWNFLPQHPALFDCRPGAC